MFIFYGEILAKFWLVKNRNEKFKQKQIVDSGGVTCNNLFHKKFVFMEADKEQIFEEKPPVELVWFKTCQDTRCRSHYENNKSPDETNLRKVLRYLRDSKYVFCILACYFLSWIPWIIVYTVDFTLVRITFYDEQRTALCGNFSADNMEDILLLIQEEVSRKGLVDSFDIFWGNNSKSTVCAALSRLYEDTTFDIITNLYFTCGASSCVLDPLIYAVWYRPVRTQIGQLWHSVKTSITSNN